MKNSTKFANYLTANNDYMSKIDIYVKPTKNVDSGKAGKGFECRCKMITNCTGGRIISKQGHCDSYKTVDGIKYGLEYKTGSGSFWSTFEDLYNTIGNNAVELAQFINVHKSNKVMIYTPEYEPTASDDVILNTSYAIPFSVLYDVVLNGKQLFRVTPSRPNVVRFSSDFKTYVFKIIEQYNLPTAKEFFEM